MLLDRFRFEVKDLAGMPEAERVFTVLLGHISNEINMLQKLIMMAHDLEDEPDSPEIQGRTAQTMCLLRVLVGKLNEAHVTMKKRYLDAGLHMKIKDELDNQAVLALNTILDSRSDNNLNVLRKKISFHNDWEFVRTNLQSIPGDAGLFFYTDGTNGIPSSILRIWVLLA